MGADARALEALLAKQAIEEVVMRYCRGVDRFDRSLVASCYHADASDSHGSFEGGVEAFLDWVFRVLGRYDATMHFLGNVFVELSEKDAKLARCESYGIAFHRKQDGEPKLNLTTGFRYIDRFEHRVGGWRIARRVATTEWVRRNDPATDWPIPPGMLVGRRDRGDPLYADFEDFAGRGAKE